MLSDLVTVLSDYSDIQRSVVANMSDITIIHT